jgi:hypothetical protein
MFFTWARVPCRNRYADQQGDREYSDRTSRSGYDLCAQCCAGRQGGLQPLGLAGIATHLYLVAPVHGKAMNVTSAPTSVALFDQGLVDVLQAAVTGLQPNHPYVGSSQP